MKHHLHGLLAQQPLHERAIGGAAEHGQQLHAGSEVAAQLLLDRIEAGLTALQQHQPARLQPQDLAAELGADRATGAAHQHHLIGDAGAEQQRIGRHGITAEQLLDRDRPQGIDAGAAAGDLLHGGHLQHGDAAGLQRRHDGAPPRAAEGGDRQQHLIDAAQPLLQGLGRTDRHPIDVAPPEVGRIIEKQFNAVAAGQAQSGRQLHAGRTGAVDGHADQGVAGLHMQAEQQIAQTEAEAAGEAGEQQPEQQPAAAGRQGQLQHDAGEGEQQHQQAIAAGEAVEGEAAHIAGEPLVLTGEGVERQADQQGGRQQPEALQEVAAEGIGQAQPETEPHRQGDHERIGADQQQAAAEGLEAQQPGGDRSQRHRNSSCQALAEALEASANGRATR